MPIETLAVWASNQELGLDTKQQVQRVLDLRRDLAALQQKLSIARTKRDQIRAETSRVSGLVKDVAPVSGDALRARYVKKLSDLEDSIEQLDAESTKMHEELQMISRELE